MEELVFFASDTGKTVMNTTSTEQIISAVDLQSGNHVSTYKKTSSPRNGICVTTRRIYALQADQALLCIYNIGKESCTQKIVLPEKLSVLSVSPNESYLAAGSNSGRLLIWEIASGNLVFEQETHYQKITVLEFTKDEAILFSGGGDARVMVWRMLDLVSENKNGDSIDPMYTWTEHTLEITDIKVGYGSSVEARVFTSSADQTLRAWDVRSGLQLTTFVLPEKITSIVVDPAERAIYAGLSDGDVCPVYLYQPNPHTGLIESRGGARQIVSIDKTNNLTQQHSGAVTALALSFDATLLVSGDVEGNVVVWDLAAQQVSKQLKKHKGPISRIYTQVRDKGSSEDAPMIPVMKRIIDTQALKQHDLWIKIEPQERSQAGQSSDAMLDDIRLATSQSSQFMTGDSQSGLQAKVQELGSDLEQLYKHYGELRNVHDQLWKQHVELATSKK